MLHTHTHYKCIIINNIIIVIIIITSANGVGRELCLLLLLLKLFGLDVLIEKFCSASKEMQLKELL